MDSGPTPAAPAPGTPPRVQMRGIRKRYGMVDAVRGVTLSVGPGEVVGLVGDNAAGKSTLMKILAGTVVPDEGEIIIDGVAGDYTTPREAREHGIEMVYQDLALCDDIDVAGNLFLGREPRRLGGLRLDKPAMHIAAARHLAALNIRIPLTDLPVRALSGGQRQAVAIARAVQFDPRLLIMDEPTAALAVGEVRTVLRLIKDIAARGVSVILITHRLQDLFEVCDRMCVMYEGELVADLPAATTSLEALVSAIVGSAA